MEAVNFYQIGFKWLILTIIQFGFEQYISIPMSLIVGILIGYVAAGAILLALWEHWDFLSGFYFAFITITTVCFSVILCKSKYFYTKFVVVNRLIDQ